MKILVFGSTGFVGKSLVKRLRIDNHEVHTAERSSGVDLRSYQETYNKIKSVKPDVIYNLAAHVGGVHYVRERQADVFHDNILMVLNIYKSVSEIDPSIKVVQPLANCSYPSKSDIQVESEWLDGDVHESVFSFGNIKKNMYYLSRCYHEQYAINTVNLIFPNAYGPGDSIDPEHTHALNGMIIRMLKAKQEGQSQFKVWGDGTPVREWIFVDDFVEALTKSLDIDNLIYPINVGQEKGYSIAESASIIKEMCEFNGEISLDKTYKPVHSVKILSKEKFDEVFKDFSFTDHKVGVGKTIAYYQTVL